MGRSSIQMPLNDLQLEILKLFARDLEEADLLAIKKLIVLYLAKKAIQMADEVWEEKKWTNEDMERLLNAHERAPYNPKN